MDLKALNAFVVVSETGNFTRAGQRLRVSQSAVSQQIRALEESLGATLFSRHARKVALTQAGDVLLPYARQILRKVEEARAVVSDYESFGRGRVAIGAGGAMCNHVLPKLLSEFRARFGKIDVQVVSGFSEETLQRTLEGRVDVGLLLSPIAQGGVISTELGRDELVAIAPAGHEFAELERVRARDFDGQSLVAYERSSQPFRILERFFLEAGVFPSVAMEINDLEAVKRMVSAGLGVSVVPSWAVGGEHGEAELVVRPLGGAGLYRTWCAVRRANETLTASQRGFLGVCTTLFPTLVSGGDADAPQ